MISASEYNLPLPAGWTATTVGEEKEHNPRLNRRMTEAAFAELMASLKLPHPKKIGVSLPANLRDGIPPAAAAAAAAASRG